MHRKIFVFVGERPSKTAAKNGWNWGDGHLADKQLADALQAVGLDPAAQCYVNLFYLDGKPNPEVVKRLATLGSWEAYGGRKTGIVGMGRKVQQALGRAGISHLKLVHPAARGTIRRKSNYAAHCRRVLLAKRRVTK